MYFPFINPPQLCWFTGRGGVNPPTPYLWGWGGYLLWPPQPTLVRARLRPSRKRAKAKSYQCVKILHPDPVASATEHHGTGAGHSGYEDPGWLREHVRADSLGVTRQCSGCQQYGCQGWSHIHARPGRPLRVGTNQAPPIR